MSGQSFDRTEDAGAYIPAPTLETGFVFARSNSQKPARFPAEQKERSFVETLLFPVSRGCRYNTLYFAIPAIKRLRRSLASLGDCKQSLSLVRRCRTSCKVVCQGDAVPVGCPATKPPVSLDSSGQEGLSPSFGIHPKSKKECAKLQAHSFLLFRNAAESSFDLLSLFYGLPGFPYLFLGSLSG